MPALPVLLPGGLVGKLPIRPSPQKLRHEHAAAGLMPCFGSPGNLSTCFMNAPRVPAENPQRQAYSGSSSPMPE
eukprot:CAMPEP_0176172128 /NCGR_PEP_ID=MMETSP0120_2-20121206/88170_1 /TAXON_ID=160619 /ORGANISM="Kryptoperidinium foliaceum, Strain CCMP 1326" /LENGTH=73 /DNA_ID=CAMNT_0017510073 /DNA_START=172 /DNA_END=390 /DNA_ORIENTATION=-